MRLFVELAFHGYGSLVSLVDASAPAGVLKLGLFVCSSSRWFQNIYRKILIIFSPVVYCAYCNTSIVYVDPLFNLF